MYLEACTIRNVKCFADITLDFRNPDGSIRLWNVLIGENGTGKTTLLQALALALMGEKAASVLVPRPTGWVRSGAIQGEIAAKIVPDEGDVFDPAMSFEEQGSATREPFWVQCDILEQRDRRTPVETTIAERHHPQQVKMSHLVKLGGWFAASYGPFRRFSGSTDDAKRIVEGGYREARFITLFHEGAALTNCADWLIQQQRSPRSRFTDEDNFAREFHSTIPREEVQIMLNNYLLPKQIQLVHFSQEGPLFDTPYAKNMKLSELSDGYRTLLVVTLDLLHRLFEEYWLNQEIDMWATTDNEELPQTELLRYMPGVVLIDELDAHLHPSLQREIALRLKHFFPALQFIIATHSPFITQAADDNGLYVLEQQGRTVQAVREETSVRGWRVDQILTSHLFGLDTTRSPEVADMLQKYDDLLAKRVQDTLTAEETTLLATIENELRENLSLPGETPEQRAQYQRMQAYIRKTMQQEPEQ